jgi:hypothetical protein
MRQSYHTYQRIITNHPTRKTEPFISKKFFQNHLANNVIAEVPKLADASIKPFKAIVYDFRRSAEVFLRLHLEH